MYKKDQKLKLSIVDSNNKILVEAIKKIGGELVYVVNDLTADTTGEAETYLEKDGSELKLDKAKTFTDSGLLILPSAIGEYESEEELTEKIIEYTKKWLYVDYKFYTLIALYVKLTWVYDKFSELPYLRVFGQYGSGKSRFLKVMSMLCYKSISTGSITDAGLFRALDTLRGTCILDEMDRSFTDNTSMIVKIFNNGYQKDSPHLNINQNTFEIVPFNIFGPKIIAMHNNFSDPSLESRIISYTMTNKKIPKNIPTNLSEEFYIEGEAIRNMLLSYRFKNYFKKIDNDINDVECIDSISSRIKQIYSPLYFICENDQERSIVVEYMNESNSEIVREKSSGLEAEILRSIMECYQDVSTGNWILYSSILNKLNDNLDYRDKTTNKRLGFLIRKRLQIYAERRRDGYGLEFSKNKDKIRSKCEEYHVEYLIKEIEPKGLEIDFSELGEVSEDDGLIEVYKNKF